nr:putative reverse transcriptase domain-containing protein [Tanacetum cinerariifolium]
MSIEIRKKEKLLQEEQWAYLSTHPSKRLLSFCFDDDAEDYTSAITPDEPVLSTEEPDNSLSMGDEHLDTIPATKSDEFIKSGVEDLIPIPSEFEGIPEHVCDVPFHDNSSPLDVKESSRKGQNRIKTEQKREAWRSREKTEFHLDEDDVLWQGTRLCVPNDATLREALLTEAHSSLFFVHPGSTKMYHDLKQHFWWSGMKRDVATFVSRCLICQQVKIEHQRASGLLQPLDIPVWK